ncbi:MAG: CapA family protein [Clostridia bacterium]|nr:CapA family protein [Clostridia bacterium]
MKTLLLGDICPTERNAELFAAKDVKALFGDTVSLFADKDFSIVNLECALTDHDGAIKKIGPPLKAPKETAKTLKMLGVTVCGLSNNHVFDFGVKGARDTQKVLTEAGLGYTGFGEDYEDSRKNYTFEKKGEKIAVVAVCEHEYSYALEDRMGSRPFDEYDTMEDIRAAKETHDRVIVTYHGGKELCRYPSPRLIKLCRAMVRNGADIVLCQHSHCIGAYESYKGGHILYGQGNFHFVKDYNIPMWHNCLAVVYDTVEHTVEFIPVKSNSRGIELARGEEKETILSEFAERNRSLADGSWRKGWHDFCVENYEVYVTKTIGRAGIPGCEERHNDRFGHYLDCEAHTDVWRELFPTYNATNEK